MKKIFLSISAFLSFLLTPSQVFAATLSLNPPSGTLNRGCSYSVKIDLDTQGANTDGTDSIIFYDSSKITPTTITNGTIYPDFPGNFIDQQSQKINISGLASVTQAFNGSGTLATVNLTIPSNAQTGAVQLNFDFDPNDKAKTTDSNVVERGTVVDVLNSVTNGNYSIGTGTCSPDNNPQSSGATPTPIGQGQVGPGQTATPSGTFLPTPTPIGQLPDRGFFDQTLILTIAGVTLTVIGILGIALL